MQNGSVIWHGTEDDPSITQRLCECGTLNPTNSVNLPVKISVAGNEDFLYSPTAISISNNKIYVSDTGDYCFKIYSLKGEFLEKIGDLGDSPTGNGVLTGDLHITDVSFNDVLLTYKIDLVNQTLCAYISNILASILNEISIKELIYNGQELIEKNKYLLKFANDELYDHQKQLFTVLNRGF